MCKRKKKNYRARPASLALLKLGNFFAGRRLVTKKFCLHDDRTLANIKPPYLLLPTHASGADVYSVVNMLLPKTASSFVVSDTLFAKWGNVLRAIGCIAKKQFSMDANIIKDMKHILSKGRPVTIYPEAKLSIDGTPNIIQPSIAKLAKMLKVPVVTLRFDGSYLFRPRWAEDRRYVDVVPTVQYLSAEQVRDMSVTQLHQYIVEQLTYDDYHYQREHNISITSLHLVEGLEYILHQCPTCAQWHAMTSQGDTLTCTKCGNAIVMDRYGVLHGCQHDSVPQWHAWQKESVVKLIDSGDYSISTSCAVYQQIGTKYYRLGEGTISHDTEGVTLQWADSTEYFDNKLFYSLSFNNNNIYLPTPTALYKVVTNMAGYNVTVNTAIEYLYAKSSS